MKKETFKKETWKVIRKVKDGSVTIYIYKKVGDEWQAFHRNMFAVSIHNNVYNRDISEDVTLLKKGEYRKTVRWTDLAKQNLSEKEVVKELKRRILEIRLFEIECIQNDEELSFEHDFTV